MGTGSVLAFDYGRARVGVAVGDLAMKMSFPLMTLKSKDTIAFHKNLLKVIQEWDPVHCIVGIPGQSSFRMECLNFGRYLEQELQQSVIYMDEDYTSCSAESYLKDNVKINSKNKHLVDKHAAHIILQSYLDGHSSAL